MAAPYSVRPCAALIAMLAVSGCERGRESARPDESTHEQAAARLDAPWMLAFLERFSSDAMAGRYTLDPDAIDRAAKMIEDEYVRLGVRPVGDAYRVPFTFEFGSERQRAHHVWVEAGGPAQAITPELVTTLSTAGDLAVVTEVVFVGHGAPPRGQAKASTGKIAIALDHAADSTAPLGADALAELIAAQRGAGARALVLIGGSAADAELARARETVADAGDIPVLALAPAATTSLFAAAGLDASALTATRKPVARPLPGVRLSIAPRSKPKIEHAANVLAWIPGAEHPEQIVVIGAHYDHIGTVARGQMCRGSDGDSVCNGADDNGSGTAMVLAIARAIAQAPARPDRTIVLAHFAGEELGLHGSKQLAKALPSAPPFAGGEIVAMVNFDMVGRLGAGGLSIGGVGSSDAWMPLLDRIGTHGVPTTYERTVSSRSDQASFYELGIPVLFFFTGLHGDYHAVGDEIAAINRDGMTAIGELALELVVALAGGAPLEFRAASDDDGLVTRMPGSDERTVEKRVGLPAPG